MQNDKIIAILGGGTMGPGIATTYILAGFCTNLFSRSQETLDRAKKVVESNLQLFCEEGIISEQESHNASERINYTTDLSHAVNGAWYVVETIVENKDAKKQLYQQLDELLPEDTIIASNTSYLDIFPLLPPARRPYGIIAHWYAPAHILPLVEIVKGPETLASVMDTVVQMHKSCGKTPVRMEKYIPGFIVNRLQSAMTREVVHLIENGYCSPEDLDLAVKTSLMPRGLLLGLVERMDFTGLDMMANSLQNKTYSPAPPPDQPAMIFDKVEKGEFGVKSGKGFYDYTGIPYEEVLQNRDKQLLKSIGLLQAFMENPLHNK